MVYTIRDIARLAGVSVTTVSRVINHRPDVNPATRKRVEQVIARCHFVGNTNARGLKQSGEVIGMVVRGRANPFLNALAEAVLDVADTLPDSLITEFIDEKDDEFQTARRMTWQNNVTGFLFVGSLVDKRVQSIEGLDLPMVFTTVSAEYADLKRASSVAVDDRAMGRLVAEEFIRLGHRNIAIFGSNPVAGDSLAKRYQGFSEALAARGLNFDERLYRETRFSLQAGYDAAQGFFPAHPEVTALFTMSDTVAIGAMRSLKDQGRSVPGDVSVFGFDGIDLGRFTVPRLSTVEQPVREIARRSVEELQRMLRGGSDSRHILVDAVLHLRESIGPA